MRGLTLGFIILEKSLIILVQRQLYVYFSRPHRERMDCLDSRLYDELGLVKSEQFISCADSVFTWQSVWSLVGAVLYRNILCDAESSHCVYLFLIRHSQETVPMHTHMYDTHPLQKLLKNALIVIIDDHFEAFLECFLCGLCIG